MRPTLFLPARTKKAGQKRLFRPETILGNEGWLGMFVVVSS